LSFAPLAIEDNTCVMFSKKNYHLTSSSILFSGLGNFGNLTHKLKLHDPKGMIPSILSSQFYHLAFTFAKMPWSEWHQT